MATRTLQETIDAAFSNPELLKEPEVQAAVEEAVARLDRGEERLAEKRGDDWHVNGWLQQAIGLFFRLRRMEVWDLGPMEYYDKIPPKKGLEQLGIRVVPPASARYGCFIEPGAILMPSFVNIGAYVGSGTMVDTWATVGSGAQIGRDVHLAGGVGIGGVLEPPGARPVIVEDGAFIGSRCVVVEGVLVEEGAVLAPNVTITSTSKIVDVTQNPPVSYQGRIPARSVVLPGSMPKTYPGGEFQVSCALIVGQRSASTDRKTSLNQVLREFGIGA